MAHFENCVEDYCKCEEVLEAQRQEVVVYYDPSETNAPN